MTADTLPVNVLCMPVLGSEFERHAREIAPGQTVEQIVRGSLSRAFARPDRVRVVLYLNGVGSAVPAEHWGKVRPKPGVRVVIRTVPGKDAVRSILLAVVTIAATVFAPQLAGALLPGLSASVGTALVATGLTILGNLLVNALIPVEQPSVQAQQRTYALDGWRNDRTPGAPVPLVLGKHRMAPPFAASSYSEIVGDDQYVRALFCFGYGPCRLSDLRIGNSPIDDFDDVEVEIREGRVGDQPMALFPKQVLEEPAGVNLLRPYPRDASGEPLTGEDTLERPVTRFTASNATQASVLLGFPSGLYRQDGGNPANRSVSVRIRMRLNGLGVWQDVTTLDISAAKNASFLRQHSWTLPSRGRWQIEVTRMTDESLDGNVSDSFTLAAVQSVRPEYPINLDKPLCLVALRVRATDQLNGPLENFNAIVEREGLVYQDGAWTEGFGRTPATAFLSALTGPSNPFPIALEAIDMELLADWHDWCLDKGLKYDRVHDQSISLDEMTRAICAAGRATPRQDGLKWGVVIDRPQEMVIDHINSRNSSGFEWSRGYFNPPHGLRVSFLDETQDWIEAERVVPWIGHEGDITVTETLDLPGKTDPDEIWTEARRRMYELAHRPDTFSAMQSGTARIVTRGDLVMASYDVLQSTTSAARVRAVNGAVIDIDEQVELGESYGVRFRTYADEDDLIGTSIVRPVVNVPGLPSSLVLEDASAVPSPGEIVHIGPINTESRPMRVRGIEAAQDFSARILMIAAAPEIDTLLDADPAPAWDGRIGTEIDLAAQTPTPPVFGRTEWIEAEGGGAPYSILVRLSPDPASPVLVTAYALEYRLAGALDWTALTAPAADGGFQFGGFSLADQVEIRAQAVAEALSSAFSSVVVVDVGQGAPIIPVQIADEDISVAGSLGHAELSVQIGTENTPVSVRIYRVASGETLDRATDLVSDEPVTAGVPLVYTDGDGTRTNLLTSAGFSQEGDWDPSGGWSVAGGRAVHESGTADEVDQTVALVDGETYRCAFTVIDHQSGDVRARLTGSTAVDGSPVTTDGRALDALVANADSTAFGFAASSNFEGAVDDAVLFEQTPTCLAAGAWEYWFEPINSDTLPGPIAGPFGADVV